MTLFVWVDVVFCKLLGHFLGNALPHPLVYESAMIATRNHFDHGIAAKRRQRVL